jgi:hypothetical protein
MANLVPQGKQYYETSAGIPLVGGKLYTYDAGTSNPRTTYQDAPGATPNANPVILDARGEATIFWAGNYKVILRDSLDNLIWTQDNVSSFVTLTYDRIAAEAAVTIVNFAYPPGNVLRYGVNTSPGVTDMSAALVTANTVANAASLLVIIQQVIHVASATTLTAPLLDTLKQMFSVTSLITINNGQPVRPEWFGTGQQTVMYAITALPTTGGIIQLEEATYAPSTFSYGIGVALGVYMGKDNVTIRGAKMPRLSDDCTKLEGGSIIQGMFLVYANKFEMSDCGVDSGFTVCATYFGGVATDGLDITYPDDTTKNASAFRHGVRLHNVIGLCKAPTSPNHAIIAGEGVGEVVCTGELVGAYGTHGIVFKCTGVRAATLTAYLNGGEGVIIKSDLQATAQIADVLIDKIYTRAQGPIGWAPYVSALGVQQYGILLQSAGGTIDKVEIGQIFSSGALVGIGNLFGGNYILSSVKIGHAILDQTGTGGTPYGLQITGSAAQAVVRINIGHLECRNTTAGAKFSFFAGAALNQHVHIEHLDVANAVNAVEIASGSYVSIGCVTTDNLSGGVYRITGTPKFLVGMLYKDANTANLYDSGGGGLVPALSNGWAQVAASDPFSVDLAGGRINLRGLVVPGASNTLSTLPQWAWPGTTKRFIAQGYNGAVQVAVPLRVTNAGVVTINEIAGGFANCATWLSLSGITYDAQS